MLRGESVRHSGLLTIVEKKGARLGGRIQFGTTKRRRFFVLHTFGSISSISWYQDKKSCENGQTEEGRIVVDLNFTIKVLTQTKFRCSTMTLEASNHNELTEWTNQLALAQAESHAEDSVCGVVEEREDWAPTVCLCTLIRRWYTGQVVCTCSLQETTLPAGLCNSPSSRRAPRTPALLPSEPSFSYKRQSTNNTIGEHSIDSNSTKIGFYNEVREVVLGDLELPSNDGPSKTHSIVAPLTPVWVSPEVVPSTPSMSPTMPMSPLVELERKETPSLSLERAPSEDYTNEPRFKDTGTQTSPQFRHTQPPGNSPFTPLSEMMQKLATEGAIGAREQPSGFSLDLLDHPYTLPHYAVHEEEKAPVTPHRREKETEDSINYPPSLASSLSTCSSASAQISACNSSSVPCPTFTSFGTPPTSAPLIVHTATSMIAQDPVNSAYNSIIEIDTSIVDTSTVNNSIDTSAVDTVDPTIDTSLDTSIIDASLFNGTTSITDTSSSDATVTDTSAAASVLDASDLPTAAGVEPPAVGTEPLVQTSSDFLTEPKEAGETPDSTSSGNGLPSLVDPESDEALGIVKGDTILVPIKKTYKRGVVRFVGVMNEIDGVMLGVELSDPTEEGGNGSREGIQYFDCAAGCGVFLQPRDAFRIVSKQKSILEMGKQEEEDEVGERDDGDVPILADLPTTPQNQYRMEAERHGEWNELFMLALAMEDSVEKYNKLSQLTTDFIAICQSYGKVIISEFFLPEKYKTLQTQSLGGVHGGSKFVVSGILFKLAQDTKLLKAYSDSSKSVYLFGKQQSNYEWASKAGGHELKSASTCLQFLEGTGLHVPMQCLVDYLGFRLICMPYLPIQQRMTHIYGSPDGGRTVQNSDPKFDAMMQWLAKQMHIAGHLVRGTYLHSAGDVEGHLGYDGRYYLLDLARAMPPEDGQLCYHLNQHNDIFYRLLRPELLQHFRAETGEGRVRPLNPDCWSGWMDKNDPNHLDYFAQNKMATHHLLTVVIPNFAAELLDKGVAGLGKMVLSVELHRRGINVRHLGVCHSLLLYQQFLRSKSQKGVDSQTLAKARRVLVLAMVQHTAKNLLRKHLRRIHRDASRAPSADTKGVAGTPAFALHTLCIRFLNLITGAKPRATSWWETILMPELVSRFGKILTFSDVSRGITEVQAVIDMQKGEGSTQKALRMLGIDPSNTEPTCASPNSPDRHLDEGDWGLVRLLEAIRTNQQLLVDLVRYVIDNLGLRLTRSGERSFEQCPVGFEFVSADVEEISTRVKKMSVVDYAFARVLCNEVDRVSLNSGDRLLQLAIKHLNSSLGGSSYNCRQQNRMANARLKARTLNQKGFYERADAEFAFAMGMANDCNDSLTLTALGLEVMAMWQQRFDATNDTNLPVVRTLTGSSSLAREHEFLNLLVQSAHPSLLRRFKQIFPPFATITSKQMDVLQLFFSCGVFEPFHLYERYHPRYRREYFSSNHSSFMCAHDTQIHFSVPVVDAAKLDLLEELTSRPQLEKKQSSEVITRDSDGSGRVGSDDNDEELRPIEDELELGDIDVNWMRPSLPATVCATVHDTEQELWRLDMLNFNNEQAFVVARALKLALRKATLPAWLLGPNVEIPLRRIAFNTPESLTSLSLQQASAQEMLWLFTAIAAQPSAIANMSFKLCTFSLVSELFSPARQELGVSSFRVMERVTDLSITECTGLETSWLFEALVGNAPLALSIIKMPFGDDDFRNFTCANRLVSLRLERTEITGTDRKSVV